MVHLISDKLIELVENHSELIIKRWLVRLLSDPTTSSFSDHNQEVLKKKAMAIIKYLGKWVSYDTSREDVGRRYAEEGKSLFELAIPLCEASRALVLLRRLLWLFVVDESALDSAFQMHQMRELNDRVILFFDRAQYYIIRGYTEAMHKKLKDLSNIPEETAEKVFFDHSFYNK
jgi:hypothetical protein